MNLQEDWGIYMATKKRTMKLKCTEFDEEFSEEYAEGTTVSLEGPQRSRIIVRWEKHLSPSFCYQLWLRKAKQFWDV